MAKTQKMNWTTIILVIYFFAGVLGTYAFVKHFLDKKAKSTHTPTSTRKPKGKLTKDGYQERRQMRSARRGGRFDIARGRIKDMRKSLMVKNSKMGSDMDMLKNLSEKVEEIKPCSEEECCGEGTVYKDGKCVTLLENMKKKSMMKKTVMGY